MEGLNLERMNLDRLPLAEAVLLLFSHTLDDLSLQKIFDQNRGRCYEKLLKFPVLVKLIRDALIGHGGSGHASFLNARRQEQLDVSFPAAYGKLGRLPQAVSHALLRHAAGKVLPLLPKNAKPLAKSLAGLRVLVLDGKTVKHVRHLLKQTQDLRAKLTGGKLAVVMDLLGGGVLAINSNTNGDANEVPLVGDVVAEAREQLKGCQQDLLWMCDAQFCDLNLPGLFTENGEHYLIRYSRNVSFHPDPSRKAQQCQDAQGRRIVQEWGWLGAENQPHRRYVRRITLFRPQVKDGDVSLISDLLDEETYPPGDLLELYLRRWGIEKLFQQLTEVFELRQLIGCKPKATIFQASLCMVLYNLVQVVKGHLAADGQEELERVSSHHVFEEIRRQMVAFFYLAGSAKLLAELGRPRSSKQLKQRLKQLLKGQWYDEYLKAPPQPGREKHYPSKKIRGGRISVERAIRKYVRPAVEKRC